MYYLLAGPLVAVVGIVAIFFVLRRKSVEKRSMYSARRSQIEHKVRAARQRTMTPHGHTEKPSAAPADVSPFATQASQAATYQAPAYEPPPVAPPAAPPPRRQQEAPATMPWEQPSIPAPAPSSFDFPAAPAAEPYAPSAPVEPDRPAPEPIPMPASEPAWTPEPIPVEPPRPREPGAPAAAASSSAAAGSWSVVSSEKESAASAEPAHKKRGKGKGEQVAGSWQLASGDAPGMDSEESEVRRSSGTLMAVAQYAVLVVGLVMVLIGVLVMVANSHVT